MNDNIGKWKGLKPDPENSHGFVYLIHDTTNDMKYIGRKIYKSIRRLPPLKGYKRKRVVVKDSDWMTYCGSSVALKEATRSGSTLVRYILVNSPSKGYLRYLESNLIHKADAITKEHFYNYSSDSIRYVIKPETDVKFYRGYKKLLEIK